MQICLPFVWNFKKFWEFLFLQNAVDFRNSIYDFVKSVDSSPVFMNGFFMPLLEQMVGFPSL